MIVFTICFLTTAVSVDTCLADLTLSHSVTRCTVPASFLFNFLSIQKPLPQTLWSYLWPSTFWTYFSCLTCDRPSQHIPQAALGLFRNGMWTMNVNGTWLKKKIN